MYEDLLHVGDFLVVLLLSEKETERAEGELGTMDSLSPRATHKRCQVWTATQQPIHYSAFLQLQLLKHIIVFHVIPLSSRFKY